MSWEHQGLQGFWLPPLELSLTNQDFYSEAPKELGTGFVWLGVTQGVSNKMYSRTQCFIVLCQVSH